jgi:hypothetical protein
MRLSLRIFLGAREVPPRRKVGIIIIIILDCSKRLEWWGKQWNLE